MSQADTHIYLFIFQTSAKNCDNVDRLFTEIAHELLQQVMFIYTLMFKITKKFSYKYQVCHSNDLVHNLS